MAPLSFRLLDLLYRCSWVAILLAVGFLPTTADAQNVQKKKPAIMVEPGGLGPANLSQDCPNQGGIVTALSVPVHQLGGDPIRVDVLIGYPAPPGGYYFKVFAEDPTIAAVGDPQQGLLPQVYIPAGQMRSNPFLIYGNKVGATILDILPQTQDLYPSYTPTTSWDINPGAAPAGLKWLDANYPGDEYTCRDPGSPLLSSDPKRLSTCGYPAGGTVSDGASQLLMRLVAGYSGTGCFEITSQGPPDQGTIDNPVLDTREIGNYDYAFSFYKAPNGYGPDNGSWFRKVQVQFAFTPKNGYANTSFLVKNMTAIRPPLLMIHGLWAGPASWPSTWDRQLNVTYRADYSHSNASQFSSNFPKVQGFAASALARARARHYAATQVDVVGHSMGGILTRLYSGSDLFKRSDNFGLGDVHRLVTLDTPHEGASAANLLVSLDNNSPSFSLLAGMVAGVIEATGFTGPGNIYKGAVCDLAENSPALQRLGGTDLLTQLITSVGGPPGEPNGGLYWKPIEFLLGLSNCVPGFEDCSGTPLFPPEIVNAFRFRQENDTIVPLTSQEAETGSEYDTYIDQIHTTVEKSGEATADVFPLLDGEDDDVFLKLSPADSNGLGNPLTVPGRGTVPDQKDYKNQCSPGGPMYGGGLLKKLSADQRVQVTSPVNGQQFAPGDTVNATVQLKAPLRANAGYLTAAAAGLGALTGTNYNGSTYQVSFVLPSGYTGPLDLTPEVVDTKNNSIEGIGVTIAVRPKTPPLSLYLVEGNYNPLLSSHDAAAVYVMGNYPDNLQLDLTSSVTGTTYTSSNNQVLTVDKEGNVQAAGFGTAVVTVQNSGLKAFAVFAVEDPTNPLAPQDLTADLTITRSGYRIDRETGFYVQTIEFTNSQPIPVVGPLYFVAAGLTSGVSLVDAGSTQNIPPAGSPYFTLDPADGITLQPGERLELTLEFEDGNRLPINYTPRVFRTLTTP